MDEWNRGHRNGFGYGWTPVTEAGEKPCDTGISFGIWRLRDGETLTQTTSDETAFLLMQGSVTVTLDGESVTHTRNSIFDDGPFCVHISKDTEITLKADSEAEWARFETENPESFPATIYRPEDVPNEQRGAGQVGGTCLRWVRTIFDGSNTPQECQLVLGEVVNHPGRWSSYPPHHHPQPEIYHYRFSDSRGFGHAELGEEVLRVRQYDTVKILDEKDHAQCSAPGYAMYYIWVIRHLPGNRYTVPEFTDEHAWTMQADAAFWQPREEVLV